MVMRCIALVFAAALPLAGRVNFVRDVKPILEQHCVRCHGPDGAMRGVRLYYKERALMTVVKKRPDQSLLYNVAKIGAMPPGGPKLTTPELDTLRKMDRRGRALAEGDRVGRQEPVPRRGGTFAGQVLKHGAA